MNPSAPGIEVCEEGRFRFVRSALVSCLPRISFEGRGMARMHAECLAQAHRVGWTAREHALAAFLNICSPRRI